MMTTHERVRARLEVAYASLRACTAAAVRGATTDGAELAVAESALDDRVSELGVELDALDVTAADVVE
jgi:hypothetical protein